MAVPEVYREKSPLSDEDCFVVFDRRKSSFTFPVHVHPEYELNFVEGASGAQRIVGDSVETIGNKDLVLIANPELKHAWKDGNCKSGNIHEITIQFHPHLLEQHLNKNQFLNINRLFKKAANVVCFDADTIERVHPLLHIITMENDGFYAVMRLFILLHELSKNNDCRELSSGMPLHLTRNAALLNRLQDFVIRHITSNIRITDTAALLNMSQSTFTRFIRSQTGLSFTEYLIDFRINVAVRKLKGTSSIPEITDECGFNSISYFCRVFKKIKGVTPTEFRQHYKKQQVIV